MKAKPLFPNQIITKTGLVPSDELVQIVQRIVADLKEQDAAITAIQDDFVSGTWTPTVTSGTGSITTLGAVVAQYRQVGMMVFISLNITITTNGTGATDVRATLPFASASMAVMAGRENAVTGDMIQGIIAAGGGLMRMFTYNNAYPGGSGYNLHISGWYERS